MVQTGGIIAGGYLRVEKIGEGGLRKGLFAKQKEPLKRKGALKQIKAGMNSQSLLLRFEEERHPIS